MGFGALIQILTGFFGGSEAGAKIGSTVANVSALAGFLAALAPVAFWLTGHKDDVFIALTYGQLAFWLGVFGGFVLAVVKVAHYTRAPGS